MSVTRRLPILAVALLLPMAYVACVIAFTMASMRLADSDRALVWITGTPAELAAASLSLQSNPWFPEVRVLAASASLPPPVTCPARSRQLSIAGLRQEEAAAARALIETLAEDNGATVCESTEYVINESRAARQATLASNAAAMLLDSGLLPLGWLVLLYLAFAGRLGLRPARAGWPPVPALAAGAAGALAWWLGAAMLRSMLSPGAQPPEPWSAAILGPGLVLAIVVLDPVMTELSFRAWMLPLVQRSMGRWPALLGSAMASTATQLPGSAAEAAPALLLGLICSALYLRFESLAACVLCSALAGASLFLPALPLAGLR